MANKKRYKSWIAFDEAWSKKFFTGTFDLKKEIIIDKFKDLIFQECEIKNADLGRSVFINCTFVNMIFCEVYLNCVTFINCSFENCVIKKCTIDNMLFKDCSEMKGLKFDEDMPWETIDDTDPQYLIELFSGSTVVKKNLPG